MSFWTAVVVIFAIAIYAKMRNDRLRYGASERWSDGPGEGRDTGPSSAELEREVAALRKRLEVLERIVTDQRGPDRLAREIESLREE